LKLTLSTSTNTCMLNHGLEWDKWVLTNLSHSIDCGLTHLFLGLTSKYRSWLFVTHDNNNNNRLWLHTRGVMTSMAALRLYHCRRNDRDRDYECDRGIRDPVCCWSFCPTIGFISNISIPLWLSCDQSSASDHLSTVSSEGPLISFNVYIYHHHHRSVYITLANSHAQKLRTTSGSFCINLTFPLPNGFEMFGVDFILAVLLVCLQRNWRRNEDGRRKSIWGLTL